MDAAQQGSDRIISTDSSDSLNILTLDAEERPSDAGNLKEQPLSSKDERIVPPNVSHDVTTMGPPRDGIRQSGSLDAGGDSSAVYPPNVYAPQAQTFYYGGYENTSGEWDEYPQYVHAEGVEVGSPGIYNENSSLMFHTGYGYSPQMPYGPYSPVTTPLPSVRGDGQLYSPFTDPYYHQPGHPSMTYITPPSPMSQAELSMTTGLDHPGAFLGETPNSNGIPYRPRPGYSFPYGSFGRGNFAGDSGNPPFYDSRQGFGSGGPWSDWSKSSDGQRSLTPLLSPVASPQPIGTISSFGHNVGPLTAGMFQRSGKHRVDSVVGTPTSPFVACPKCHIDICTNCRQLAHADRACSELSFGVDQETAELLKRWGYKRCPKCGNGVRRMFGCNHMECLCGSHWCWVCLKPRDECEGGCYEDEDEDYESGEEERGGEEEDNPQPEPQSLAVASTAAAQETATEDASIQPTEPQPQPASPRPIPRPRNLDAGSRSHWEEQGLDFGEEPSDDIQDRVWGCWHRFEKAKLSYEASLRSAPHTRDMECSKCWNAVYPTIETPSHLDMGGTWMVAGISGARSTGRGRIGGRARGGTRRRQRRAHLVRGDATIGSPLSQSLPSDSDVMENVWFSSNNGDRVTDTYGNVITSTDWTMPAQPHMLRTRSFDFSVARFEDSSPAASASQPADMDSPMGFDGTDNDASPNVTHTSPFSFAYECHACNVLVCETCRDEMLEEQRKRDEEEAAERGEE